MKNTFQLGDTISLKRSPFIKGYAFLVKLNFASLQFKRLVLFNSNGRAITSLHYKGIQTSRMVLFEKYKYVYRFTSERDEFKFETGDGNHVIIGAVIHNMEFREVDLIEI